MILSVHVYADNKDIKFYMVFPVPGDRSEVDAKSTHTLKGQGLKNPVKGDGGDVKTAASSVPK